MCQQTPHATLYESVGVLTILQQPSFEIKPARFQSLSVCSQCRRLWPSAPGSILVAVSVSLFCCPSSSSSAQSPRWTASSLRSLSPRPTCLTVKSFIDDLAPADAGGSAVPCLAAAITCESAAIPQFTVIPWSP